MYILKKNNIERMVSDETALDNLLSQGFSLIKKEEPQNINNSNNEEDKELNINLNEMSVDELKTYAEEKGIDLGKSTSQSGIIEKIKAAIAE